ncbi:MAG TPA: 50S ribosomal protein L19 [Candidatus Brocadiales bacterium]|nr:50S ribosomal protein L19 [Candidatus Brocadiales bacterium]
MNILDVLEKENQKATLPQFEVGDTVEVYTKIIEGEKERTQIFNGVVIGKKGGGLKEVFVARRMVQGEGVERVFALHSPRLLDVKVVRSGKVRRAKLYYLREKTGKEASRLKEKFVEKKGVVEKGQA